MFHFKKTFTALTLLLLPLLSLAQEGSTDDVFHQVYKARLSEKDHFSSSGQRLKTAAAILRQDRANFHVFNIKDAEDEYDETFKDKEAREYMEKMVVSISKTTEKAVLNGTPTIQVEIFGDGGAEVTLITENGAADKVFNASFDCNKAATFIEKAICGNERISNLDNELAVNFKAVKNSMSDDEAKELIASQKQWLSVRNKCTDDKCLIDSYSKRIAAIAGNSSVSNVSSSNFGGAYSGNNLSMKVFILDKNTASAEITTATQNCDGEISGRGNLIGNTLKFQSQDSAENCVISVIFNGKGAEISEDDGCSVFHGLNCSFNGTVHNGAVTNTVVQEVAPPVQETIQAPQPEVQPATTAPQVVQPAQTIDYANLTNQQKREIAETVDYGSLTAQQRRDLADQYIEIGKAQAQAKGEQRMIIFAAVVIAVITLIIVAFLYFRKKSASKAPLEFSLKEPVENQTDGVKGINELDVSESWKKKFEILERAGEFKNGSYENFKALSFMERRKIGFNFIAFIGQPFYYFFKKMWGKGWVLFGLTVLINTVITVIEMIIKTPIPNAVYQIVPAVMFAQMANYDFYRFKVYNETMWKPFLKLNKPAAYIGFAVVSIAILLGVSALR